MFRHHQIFTSSELQRNFKKLAAIIAKESQAPLITQKGAKSLVILPADAFDKLIMNSLAQISTDNEFNSTD